MSSSDALDRPADTLARATETLSAAVGDPDRVSDAELRALMAAVVKLYATKAEADMRTPLPSGGGGLTVAEIMVTVTDLLHALNVQVFELSMWQAMSGNCIAPHQRIDTPETR